MEKGVIVVHREKDEIQTPQNSRNNPQVVRNQLELGYRKNHHIMKRSPLLEESLKAVIEETEEELEDCSVFDSTNHRLSITRKEDILESEADLQEKNKRDGLCDKREDDAPGLEDKPCFLFQPNINQIANKKREEILPPKDQGDSRPTLVLDLDETLVHFCEITDENGNQESKTKHLFLVRPYVSSFLTSSAKLFEIVIFTASVQNYADYILDILDPHKKFISHRLYRRHCDLRDNVYIKDLSKFGRELSQTLIVDNNADNFQLQPDNGILIKSWYGEEGDQALKNLGPLLEEIALSKGQDVRVCMKKIGDRYQPKKPELK